MFFPYRTSAGEAFRAACGVVLRLSKTHGNFFDQSLPWQLAVSAVLRVRWHCFIMPLHSGLYVVVCFNLNPKLSEREVNKLEVKFVPLSVTSVSGMPCLLIHCIRALAEHSAVAAVIGMASGQRVALSIMVNMYEYPLEGVTVLQYRHEYLPFYYL